MHRTLFFLCLSLILTSCQSVVKTKTMANDGTEFQKILSLEEKIYSYRQDNKAQDLTVLRREAETLTTTETLNKDFRASAWALMGEIDWLSKRPDLTAGDIKNTERADSTDDRLLILKSLLETNSSKRMVMLEKGIKVEPDFGPFILEKAMIYYQEKRYREAAASFDEALNILPQGYRKIFEKQRELSFQLKETEGNVPSPWLLMPVLSVEGMIALTSAETPWLDFLQSSVSEKPSALFPKIIGKGLLPENSLLTSGTDRRTAAYFLYHLLSYREQDSGMLRVYSSRYGKDGNQNGKNPVPDISPSDPCFDSVLGMVEREAMDLPDGINFQPDKTLSGTEFHLILLGMKKIVP